VFDPERDDDHGSRRFYVRLLVILWISAAGCAALLPSVTGFSVGPDRETSCVAIVNGWHADRAGLSKSDEAIVDDGFRGNQPPPDEQALFDRSYAYDTWREGPGACIPESRHRLILSGLGLGALALVAGGGTLVVRRLRTRKNLRPEPAFASA